MVSAAVREKTRKFLKLYGSQIANAISDKNLYFSAVVGQKCNESGYGTSSLAKLYNNFGGIRGIPKEAYGKTSDGWAKFATPQDCFKCYARFLNEKPQYAKVLRATSPEEQIKELVKAGYCEINTNKNSKSYMPSAEYYLNNCKGAIDATKEVCKGGLVTSSNLYATISDLKNNNTI